MHCDADQDVAAAACHLEQLLLSVAEVRESPADWRIKAKAFDSYTRALMNVGLWQPALWALGKWLSLAEFHNDTSEQARVHGLTGVVHLREGNLVQALRVRPSPPSRAPPSCILFAVCLVAHERWSCWCLMCFRALRRSCLWH